MSKFSDYLEAISQLNGLGNGLNLQWLFHCGMLFSTRDKWWGDFKFRHATHEGIDITYYRTRQETIQCFDDSTRVPAMDDGILLNICDDFLGQTLVIEHKTSIPHTNYILFVYSHIIPEMDLKKGQAITKGAVIARVCDTHKNPQLPPHLHFSCFEVSKKNSSGHLDWKLFSKNHDVKHLHPLFL